ncbi:acyloxyacyl hydrolase [Pedobacter polaris]|uniref:Acyloxyacyl hydrolase n=1 Tax=Pedobacter polaris TaxID=2571273 RepID=A0A4U1CKU8_9SPHI|nr:acyloxyacyl hydrolase [Pedobacter polaris]TKC08294.1 acyloxyacyl hydrolase [Pedobacter polaris]
MKKLLLSLALVAGLGFAASAQTEGAVRKLSIGGEVGLPTESGSKDWLYVGGSLQYEHPVAKSLNLTGSAGYTALTYTGSGPSLSLGFIPLKAGAKYYFGGNFYGAGEVGATISTENGGGTAFAFAPGLGASFSVSDKSSLDFGLRYETWSNNGSSSFVGLRAAWAFGL